jgi:hypothetical protein
MSWELEHLKRRGWNHPSGSAVALIGFVLGLLVMSTTVVLYFWLLAWIAPLVAGKYSQRLTTLADGALAATVFGIVFAIVGAIALAS